MNKATVFLLALGIMFALYRLALFIGDYAELYEMRKGHSRIRLKVLEHIIAILLFFSFPMFFLHILHKVISKGLGL